MTDGRHAVAEDVSLELHRAVAKRLLEDPALVERARERVAGWLRDGSVARPYAEAWRDILASRQPGHPRPLPGRPGLCLEPHDPVISKYAAGREKDREYVRVAIRNGLVDPAVLLERLAVTAVDPGTRERIARQIEADSPR